jgi:short-subunit dehydrogenase
MHEFLAEMRKRGSGHVITIGSMGDRMIYPGKCRVLCGKFGFVRCTTFCGQTFVARVCALR